MIRPAREVEDLSDDDFAKALEPSEKEIKDYLLNDFLYDFFARCLATDFKNDSIWADSNLEMEYADAMAYLSLIPARLKRFDLDLEKLKSVLEKKHSLNLTSVNPIGIEEIK